MLIHVSQSSYFLIVCVGIQKGYAGLVEGRGGKLGLLSQNYTFWLFRVPVLCLKERIWF